MPILSTVGRRHPSQAITRGIMYVLLTFGATCIVYPILLVLGQATSDDYDLRDNALVPYYLYDRNELALKHVFSFTEKLHLLASRHHRNAWTSQANMRADTTFYETRPAAFAEQGLNLDARRTMLRDLNDFKRTIDPDHLLAVAFRVEDHYRPFLRDRYGKEADALTRALAEGQPLPEWLIRAFPDRKVRRRVLADRDRLGVAIMNHELRSDYNNYYAIKPVLPGNFTVPVWRPAKTARMAMWRGFKAALPPDRKLIINADAYWHDYLHKKYTQVAALNAAWGTSHAGICELVLPLEPPAAGPMRRDWDEFIVKRWPRRLLKLPPDVAPAWRAFVKSRFRTETDAEALAKFNRATGLTLERWDDLALPTSRPADDVLSRYWCEFTFSGRVPADKMILDAPETGFRRFLQARYGAGKDEQGALDALNAAWKSSFTGFDRVPLPLAFSDDVPVRFDSTSLRWRFAAEPFRRIFEYIFGRSRAAWNTLILVTLSLLSALTVNPLAAYSLSRFSMRRSHRILIFFLATMAFPAEVAMIPNFLLMRDLHLLNTYAALILPGMANGFAIFLLKCFFDSLPRELYEAAEIDGARELQVFRMVALPLLTPILAYIGLGTFVFAYSGFMWAFVICPKQEMWTIMVWVYDFQSYNPGNNYIMAATLMVSIPPLVVFLFANRIIMRGIMIPSMK